VSLRDDIAEEIPRLRRYARVLLRDRTAADDLVQDCLERAISREHLFQPGTNLRAWLFTIMHNLHVNAIGRSRRMVPVDPTDNTVEERRAVSAGQGDRLVVRDLERALDALSDEQRAVVLLIGVEGLSYAEAAGVLEVPMGTIMSRLARGRERLRRLMDGEEPDQQPGKTP